MFNLFAHGFVLHKESQNDTLGFFDTANDQLTLNLSPFVLLLLILLLMHKLKVKQSWMMSFTLVYLLVEGLIGYRYMPVASIVSIVAGFGLSLAWAIQPLSKISRRGLKK